MMEKNVAVTVTVLMLSLLNLDNRFWWSSLVIGAVYLVGWWACELIFARRFRDPM